MLSSFAPYTTIHLASGLYLTNGYAAGVTGGWQPKRGQRIVGAGIDVTTLKLTPGATVGALYFAIGADDAAQVNEFEAADMTIDCNLAGQSAAVAAGAIKVYGTHIRIRRIRAIHFGTQTTAQRGVAIVTAGAFPDYPEPFDCVVEDCILDLPFLNNVRETACITFAGGERPGDGVMAHHKGCVVRNCFIDCKYSNNEVPISTISFSNSATGTVLTKVPHNLVANQWVVITGAVINGVLPNDINGSFTATPVVSDTYRFTITSANSQPANPTGDMYINRPPSQRVAISGLSVSGTVATLTTITPHNRVPGQNVVLNNVLVGGSPANAFNAAFPITQIVSPTALQFTISPNPGTPINVANAWFGVDFYAFVANGGRGVIVEGNRTLNTTFGLYRDSWSTKDVVIRDNYFVSELALSSFALA